MIQQGKTTIQGGEEVTSLPVLEPAKEAESKTRAGNYFVANYPPFSCWLPEHTPDVERMLDRPPADNRPLGLYIHIPFCRKRCHFCYFRVYTDRNAAQIKRYLDAVIAEAAMYAKRSFVGDRPIDFVYFGGGTPSYLSADQLKYLVDGVTRHLPWDKVREITFEAEPGTLNENKVQAIRDLGVTRLSYGVENLNDQVLELNNRAHHVKEVLRAYDWARSVGFPQINIDLIAGMLGETEANWHDCVEKTIALTPDCVTIYQMEIPFNTTIYKRMKDEGKLEAPVADWPTKRRWVAEAFERLEQAGYTISSAYTAVRDPKQTRFLYRDALWHGSDLLGIGVASFSHVQGIHFQNQHDDGPYMDTVESGRLPIHRAMTPNADERLIREFVLQMKLGSVEIDYFQKKFDVDVRERFAEPLASLKAEGWLTWDNERIRMHRHGLLEVDRLLHSFFLPEHQRSRYA